MYRLTAHAKRQATLKGVAWDFLLDIANDPTVSYPNGRFPGQMRHVKNGWVAVVRPEHKIVITVYQDVVETPLRPDQVNA